MTKLPDKLWQLAELALVDLEEIEADPHYRLNMNVWHCPDSGEVCEVCLAGAVMARELGVKPTDSWRPELFGVTTKNKLLALDWLRNGCLEDALRSFYHYMPYPPRTYLPHEDVEDYHVNPAGFKAAMRKLIDQLKERDL